MNGDFSFQIPGVDELMSETWIAVDRTDEDSGAIKHWAAALKVLIDTFNKKKHNEHLSLEALMEVLARHPEQSTRIESD